MLNAKFVRAHAVPSSTFGFAWFFKLVYEFWGFCVNGGSDLLTPGGFASTNPVSMPAGFLNSVGLLASGTDGFTVAGQSVFSTISTPLPPTALGKHLVLWKSGSSSTDDSVYEVTRWINSSSIRINALQGGTPFSGTQRPGLTDRGSINYRIIDLNAIAALSGYSSADHMVLQLNAAGIVNPGQRNSQFMLRKQTSPFYSVGITLSPSGSWNGSNFADQTDELLVTGSGWFGAAADNPAFVTLLGSQDFLIAHFKAQQPQSSGFHVEVPQRLYPSNVDPNPVLMMNYGSYAPSQTDPNAHYGGGIYMHNPPDGMTAKYFAASRQLFGDSGPAIGAMQNSRTNGAVYNAYTDNMVFVDAVLARTGTLGQFQMARARIRRARFTVPFVMQYMRFGSNGEWIHVGNGVLWPWDNSELPYPLFVGGS